MKILSDSDDRVVRRIRMLTLHLRGADQSSTDMAEEGPRNLAPVPCARANRVSVITSELSSYMRGNHRDVQERIFQFFESRPDLQTPVSISMEDHRELCMRQITAIVRDCGIRPFRHLFDDPDKYFAIMEAVGAIDMSIGVKMGVQFRY